MLTDISTCQSLLSIKRGKLIISEEWARTGSLMTWVWGEVEVGGGYREGREGRTTPAVYSRRDEAAQTVLDVIAELDKPCSSSSSEHGVRASLSTRWTAKGSSTTAECLGSLEPVSAQSTFWTILPSPLRHELSPPAWVLENCPLQTCFLWRNADARNSPCTEVGRPKLAVPARKRNLR